MRHCRAADAVISPAIPARLGCLFLSSFDNVPACFPPYISDPHLFFMHQTVDFRDYFEQAFRVLPVSRFHAEPHPMPSLFAFHFALRRSLATAQSKLFGRPLLAAFVPIQHGSPPTSEKCTDALQDNKIFTPHLSPSEFRR